MKLYEILRKLRQLKNYTQDHLATLLQISRTTYANYEQGRREPDYETITKIAKIYGVTVDYLLGIDEQGGITVIVNEPKFKSDAHKSLYHKVNSLEEEDLLLVSHLIDKINDKNTLVKEASSKKNKTRKPKND